MIDKPQKLDLKQWDKRYDQLQREGLTEPSYGGKLSRHIDDGDYRLLKLKYDNSAASLRLWNFLLTENQRLEESRSEGKKIVGTMKDLGTVPVMAYSLDNVIAFYPDGAYWIPCIMELSDGLFKIADSLGIDDSFCPVRAVLGAFVSEEHFPIPDILTCSVGATCDDFSAIAQRLEHLGHKILWWEMPHRRRPESDEEEVTLPGGFSCPQSQVDFVRSELSRIKIALQDLSGQQLDDKKLAAGISKANNVRSLLTKLRGLVFTADACPMPALEMLVVEMFAIHFCSNIEETAEILEEMIIEVENRLKSDMPILRPDAARIFWINPVADLRVMNLLEDCGGRICGTDYLFNHAIDPIPENMPTLEALAQMALADPMVGSARDRAERIYKDFCRYRCEAVLISRIPGASHCAVEGKIIKEFIQDRLEVPVMEIEVPPVTDSMQATLRTRLEALVEVINERR